MTAELEDQFDDRPKQETFAGEETGVEIELAPDDDELIKPWDPEKIRVSTKNFSLRNVLDMIDSDDLDLAPDFQRNRVWKERQKSRLVESLLLQIPLPAFYFAEDPDGMLRVVDGLQRLSTIHAYVRGLSFGLRDLEYLTREHGKTFAELDPPLQRRLNNAQIVVHVIDPSTPADVKYDIFKRINTGGEPLNPMEIRHCMSKTRSRDFLKRCTASDAFHRATGGVLRNHIRMHDREATLRFLAFRLLRDLSDYDKYGSLERLLDATTQMIDNPQKVSDAALDELFKDFERAMRYAFLVFREHAFRKWNKYSSYRSPINRALFESWAIALLEYDEKDLANRREAIVEQAREAMTTNFTYIDSISSSTGDVRRVHYRFQQARELSKAGS